MSRIPLVDPDDPDADPKARALLLRLRLRTGRDINVLRALANHPDVLEKFLSLGNDPAPAPHISPAQRGRRSTTRCSPSCVRTSTPSSSSSSASPSATAAW